MKKYFEIPSVKLVSMTEDVITTSNLNNQQGNASTGGILAPDPRKTIWN